MKAVFLEKMYRIEAALDMAITVDDGAKKVGFSYFCFFVSFFPRPKKEMEKIYFCIFFRKMKEKEDIGNGMLQIQL